MAMTLGKDVSALFPDVLKNIATADLEQKKLVYLYLMWVFVNGQERTHADGLTPLGTMRSRIPTYAFSPSIPSYKIRKTPTR